MVSINMIKQIKDEVKKGSSKEAIIKKLVKKGYHRKEIKEVLHYFLSDYKHRESEDDIMPVTLLTTGVVMFFFINFLVPAIPPFNTRSLRLILSVIPLSVFFIINYRIYKKPFWKSFVISVIIMWLFFFLIIFVTYPLYIVS